jgi:phosphate transport system substrate-binding protein
MTISLAFLARKAGPAVAGALLALLPLSAAPVAASELRGAGSTFAAPLYEAWIGQFRKERADVALRYDAVGSGEGLQRFQSGAVDFAGSDVALSASAAEKIERGALQLPATAGMIVLAYNLPGLGGALKLPHDVLADIFLGALTTWNHPRIAAANPGVSLPATTIAVVGRQDSSGTTHAFTSHLAAISPAWSDKGPGVGKAVAWPHLAMLARGNEGVASKIKISEGAIGYVEYGFAKRLALPVALIENKDGRFVAPTPEAGAAAIAGSAGRGLKDLAAATVNPAGAEAYPIVTYSWLVAHRAYPSAQGRDLKAFLRHGLDQGQASAAELGYIPLPRAVADLGRAVIDQINSDASAVAPR